MVTDSNTKSCCPIHGAHQAGKEEDDGHHEQHQAEYEGEDDDEPIGGQE